MTVFLRGILAAMNENPSPMDTDPMAMGRLVRSVVNLDPVLTDPIAIALAMFTDMIAEPEAMSRLLRTAPRLVPVPDLDLAAMSAQALSVTVSARIDGVEQGHVDGERHGREYGARRERIRA